MSVSRRLAKPGLVVLSLAALAVIFSACAVYKEGSLRLSQPGGIGPVGVHFAICTKPDEGACTPEDDEGQAQYMLGLAVPQGATAPATITAAPVDGAAPIVFNRNEEVTRALSEVAQQDTGSYPPSGTESAGYLSAVFEEETGETHEWSVDAQIGLPLGSDGGPYAGPFKLTLFYGWRKVDDAHPASRPVDCFEPIGEPPTDATALCGFADEGQSGTSDLKIVAPPTGAAYVGGKASIAFPLDFASTAPSLPSFALIATTTLPNAQLAVASPTFSPGAPDPNSHRSPAGSGAVAVTVPSTAGPGIYDVTLTATTSQGASVSQVAKLQVTKPKLKLGGVRLNKAKGTATLSVKVPSAGTLTATGKGIVKAKKKAKKAKKLKITIRAKGKTKAQLEAAGKAKVKAKLSFKPSSGIAAKKSKSITLKQS